MDEHVALRRFVSERVAVLGTVSAAGAPHLVPVTFALLDDCVVFAVDHKPKRSLSLRRLENIAGNPAVSFLVDRYDDDWQQLWWVRVDARATTVPEVLPHSRDDLALDALAAKYPQYRRLRPAGVVVIARITAVSGWAYADDPAAE